MVKIISDSTCDLSKELIEQYDITILPLHVLLGNEEYEDGVNIHPDEIYVWADKHQTTPKTSAPSMDDAMKMMEPMLAEGHELVCFSISSSMSASGNVMRLAAEDLEAEDKVTVVDSANLSVGVGMLVLEAAAMAKEGKSRAEIAAKMEELKPRVRTSFVVDTLTYLHRGGRCSGVAALAGGMLKLHPLIAVEAGAMAPGKKYRGKMERVLMEYAKDLEPQLREADPKRVIIVHSGCTREFLDLVHQYMSGLEHFDEVLECRAGGVISSHCGPGAMGIAFLGR